MLTRKRRQGSSRAKTQRRKETEMSEKILAIGSQEFLFTFPLYLASLRLGARISPSLNRFRLQLSLRRQAVPEGADYPRSSVHRRSVWQSPCTSPWDFSR